MIKVDRLFKAFADETRLRVLHLLTKRKELCVCDIIAVLGAPQSKVSRHLGYLKRAGLVTDRKDSLWRYYSLAKPASVFHERLIDCLGSCLNEAPVLHRDAQKLSSTVKARCR